MVYAAEIASDVQVDAQCHSARRQRTPGDQVRDQGRAFGTDPRLDLGGGVD
jgi:hypothetical protein